MARPISERFRPPYDIIVRDRVIYIEAVQTNEPIATVFIGKRNYEEMVSLAQFLCDAANAYDDLTSPPD